MIKKEERSEIITVPTNISTAGQSTISVPVPYSVLAQQNASQLTNSLTNQINLNQITQLGSQLVNSTGAQPQLAGQPASVISMSWASAPPPVSVNTAVASLAPSAINPLRANNSQPTTIVNQTATMPVNAIQNASHAVLPSTVHLAAVPTTITTGQRPPNATQIRPNMNTIIQDNRSHPISAPMPNNHSLHHINPSLHHVPAGAAGAVSSQLVVASANAAAAAAVNQLPTQQPHQQPNANSNQPPSLAANAVQPPASAQPPQQQFQRLKVEDALSYLDKVKLQFQDQPQVYNDFLDIMKEFKSQSIDTPGVIQRVSNLFRGHPELIVGFNTFLPPGYKIEMQANDQINVSLPNRTTSAIIISGPPTSLSSNPPAASQATIVAQQPANASLPNNIQQAHLGNLNTANLNSTNRPINLSASGASHPLQHHAASMPTNQPRNASNLLDQQSMNSLTAINGQQQPPHQQNASQPVEFNHAINYVNKIKSRFQGQPDVYKQFLEILHAYQKEQKSIKEGKQPDSKPLTENEVYAKVAKLFHGQNDLLQEFGQFLPDSNSGSAGASMFGQGSIGKFDRFPFIVPVVLLTDPSLPGNLPNSSISTVHSAAQHVDGLMGRSEHGTIVKRPIIRGAANSAMGNVHHNQANVASMHAKKMNANSYNQSNVPNKKPKMTSLKDVSFAEASKMANLNEYSFFDKVRKALKNQEVYDNFLRFLVLYNHEILSKSELLSMTTNFLGKHPELLKWFKDFLGHKNGDGACLPGNNPYSSQYNHSTGSNLNNSYFDGLSNRVVGIRERERDRMSSEVGMEIDYNSCKRYGASYRALPKNFVQPKCGGRTQLCKDVLNDIWVSFPSWSEDSTFVTSRKTQYEEYIYRCEDERFELDVVIETNLTAIRVFEALQKKLNRMTPEERNKYKLDDTLGGSSVVIIQRAIKRIYGDKAPEIVEGLKKSPAVAVPLVYRRLKSKEEEWREAQKQFNKIWREQNEKYYLKSLDHQSITFKQNDIKFLRSKSLINEIESIFDERHEQNEENGETTSGPHMVFVYKHKPMIEEACNLIIHHVKRQTSIHKSDKQKIKQLLKHFIPDLFGTARGELSDDEQEETDPDEQPASTSNNGGNSKEKEPTNSNKVKSSSNFSFKDLKNSNSSETNNNNNTSTNQPSNSSNGTAATTTTTTNQQPAPANGSNNNQKPTASSNTMLNSSPDDVYSLFIVNQSWYLFFRLHYILCDRLGRMQERAAKISEEEAKEKSFRKDSPAVALRLKHKTEYEAENYFAGLIDMVKQLLDGNLDSNQFEDQLREMFGIHAYVSFTLDKVVQNIVRQLQHIVCEEISVQTTELFIEASKANAAGGPCSTAHLRASMEYNYQKKAESLLIEENIFKVLLFKDEGKVTIELLDSESTDSEDESAPTVKWMDYINKYAKENSELSESMKQRLMRRPLFLLRNIKVFKESNTRDLNALDKEENIEKATKSVEMSDNTECKFDVNSFKAVYLMDTGSYLYRTKSLLKARVSNKAVNERTRKKFGKFKDEFVRKNCTKEQITTCEDWLKGKCYETEPESKDETGSNKSSKAVSSEEKPPVKEEEPMITT